MPVWVSSLCFVILWFVKANEGLGGKIKVGPSSDTADGFNSHSSLGS